MRTHARILVTAKEALHLATACRLRAEACHEQGEFHQEEKWRRLLLKCLEAHKRAPKYLIDGRLK